MQLLYVYADRHPEDLRELVRSKLPESYEIREMSYSTNHAEQARNMSWADSVLFAPARFLPDEIMRAGRQVKLMQLWSSGYDKFNIVAARQMGIPVANNGGANRIAVAEQAFLLMLAVLKKLPDSHRRVVNGSWSGNRHGMDMFTLNGKTLGIIGMGAIGREVAHRAQAFGMSVVYHDVREVDTAEWGSVQPVAVSLHELLERSDLISLHLHLDEKTQGLLGPDEFSKMKRKPMLINVSRAQLVDRKSLELAMKNGVLAGYGADVHYEEPTISGDPLLGFENFVGTPHSACTFDTHLAALDACVENLERVRAGLAPLWIVN